MEIQALIAENVRALRLARGLTLEEAARLTGVSRSMIAQIERAEVNPTISVLWKIAGGYRVSFSSLLESGESAPELIRGADITPLAEDGGRYLNYPLFPFGEGRPFETYRIEIKPQGFLQAQPHLAGAEEYITVFSGEVEIAAGEKVYRLAAGDSLRFAADVPHSYRNPGAADALLSMIIHYGR